MIGWAFDTLVSVTALMLLVLAVRDPVARLFGAGWAYALWLVPALRLVMPPLPAIVPDIALPTAAFMIPAAAGGTAPLPAEAGPGQWLPIMLVMWAGGAVLFMIHQWRSYRLFLRRVEGDARPARPPRYGGITLLVSAAAEGPLALGLFRRRIVLPPDFEDRYSPDERRLALEHELTHHRRGDIWWNVAAAAVLAFNWFNPVAWMAFRAFRADQELACDAAVAARASLDERCDYARALVKSASRPGLIAACAFNSTSQLKRRLRMMRGHNVSAARRLGGAATLTALGLGSLALAAPAPPLEVAAAAPTLSAAPAAPAAEAAPVPARAARAVAVSAPRKARRVARPAPAPERPPLPEPAPALAAASQAAPIAPETERVTRYERRIALTEEGGPPRIIFVRVAGGQGHPEVPPPALLARLRLAAEGGTVVHIAHAAMFRRIPAHPTNPNEESEK